MCRKTALCAYSKWECYRVAHQDWGIFQGSDSWVLNKQTGPIKWGEKRVYGGNIFKSLSRLRKRTGMPKPFPCEFATTLWVAGEGSGSQSPETIMEVESSWKEKCCDLYLEKPANPRRGRRDPEEYVALSLLLLWRACWCSHYSNSSRRWKAESPVDELGMS